MKNIKVDPKILTAVASIVLGIMFIVLKGGVIGITLTLVGVIALAMAVLDFINGQIRPGVIKAVIGAAVLILGWVLVDIAVYLIAGVLIVFGIYQIVSAIKNLSLCTPLQKVLSFVKPAVILLAGLCLFFNKNGMIDWMFIIVGALILAEGVIAALELIKK